MRDTDNLSEEKVINVPELSSVMKRMRLRILHAVSSQKLDEAFTTLRDQLSTEKDENRRLGSLAAQTWLIRQRLQHLDQQQVPTVDGCLEELDPKRKPTQPLTKLAPQEKVTPIANERANASDWTKVKIIEETVVNGMRFFENSVIEVNHEDAKKLHEAKKAEIIQPDTPPVEPDITVTNKADAKKAVSQKTISKKKANSGEKGTVPKGGSKGPATETKKAVSKKDPETLSQDASANGEDTEPQKAIKDEKSEKSHATNTKN